MYNLWRFAVLFIDNPQAIRRPPPAGRSNNPVSRQLNCRHPDCDCLWRVSTLIERPSLSFSLQAMIREARLQNAHTFQTNTYAISRPAANGAVQPNFSSTRTFQTGNSMLVALSCILVRVSMQKLSVGLSNAIRWCKPFEYNLQQTNFFSCTSPGEIPTTRFPKLI